MVARDWEEEKAGGRGKEAGVTGAQVRVARGWAARVRVARGLVAQGWVEGGWGVVEMEDLGWEEGEMVGAGRGETGKGALEMGAGETAGMARVGKGWVVGDSVAWG